MSAKIVEGMEAMNEQLATQWGYFVSYSWGGGIASCVVYLDHEVVDWVGLEALTEAARDRIVNADDPRDRRNPTSMVLMNFILLSRPVGAGCACGAATRP